MPRNREQTQRALNILDEIRHLLPLVESEEQHTYICLLEAEYVSITNQQIKWLHTEQH
jgi:hypothetical protein